MKKMILFLFVLLSVLVSAQDFRPVMVPGIQSIFNGCKVDNNTLFLSGNKQTVYKSTDGGNIWLEKFTNDSINYDGRDISFGNASTGYTVSSKGKMLKSVDGGETWNWIPGPDSSSVLIAVNFFDDNNGFVLTTKGTSFTLFKTTDGGLTWLTAVTATGSIADMDFYSATKGILAGGGTTGMFLYYTTDGTTWTKAPAPTIPSTYGYTKYNIHAVKYVNENIAYGCGWGSTVGMQPTLFIKTTDGGVSWTYLDQAAPNRQYLNMYTIYFKDELNGISAGFNSNPGIVFCKTSDGGVNWVPQNIVPSAFTPKALLGNGDKIVLAGSGGNIIVSSDFGNSWVRKNSIPNSTLYSIELKNSKVFAAGYESNFYKSVDNGASFTGSYFSTGDACLRPNDLTFVDENIGYAAMMYGQVLKTTDGGDSWSEVLPDSDITSRSNNGIDFIDENTGFTVGVLASNLDVIYKTSDGGLNWNIKQGFVTKTLNCVAFADQNHAAIGGNSGKMLFTTDQGENWTEPVINTAMTSAIQDINFIDAQNGIAVGGVILKTTNAGAEWNVVNVSFLDKGLLSVIYFDANTVYAGGDKYLLKSVDGGNNWTIIGDTSYFKNNKVQALNLDNAGYLWVATQTGIILTNSPVNSINDEALDPNSFTLEQNYPNPFNPSTTIYFSLNKRGSVTLKLFDVLGREVKEIFKGDMEAGKHSMII